MFRQRTQGVCGQDLPRKLSHKKLANGMIAVKK
jgi:hypothetical protein